MLPELELLIPESLPEVLGALSERAPDVAPWAGGTNLLVDLRARRYSVGNIVGLDRVADLGDIRFEDGMVSLGARVTLADVLREPRMRDVGDILLQCARVFAGAPIRNLATVAGNVAYASPAGDSIPPLLVLGAEVILEGEGGERTLPMDEFHRGVRRTAREPHELITAIRWPKPKASSAGAFHKLGLRKGDAVSVVSVAAQLTLGEDGSCQEGRIALGAVAPKAMRAYRAEEAITGNALTPTLIKEAGRIAAEECSPIDDVRASAEYRRRMVAVLVRRALTQIWDELRVEKGAG
jgi:CO/xanthine dehydrogenase FAD-binding subunit